MHSAFGYCSSKFSPSDPGRLCRGRERWIEAAETAEIDPIHRLVVSGACFTDDSARDAQRGVKFSGIDVATLVHKLFPDHAIVAWAEDAHPRQVPELARGLEAYDQAMPRGPLRRWAVRWSMLCPGDDELREAMTAGADVVVIFSDGPESAGSNSIQTSLLPPLADAESDPRDQGGLSETLRKLLFLLTGYRSDGPPFRCFQPGALPELLAQPGCEAVILIHQDKHAPCIGIYLAGDGHRELSRLDAIGAEMERLVVPFAIPPMLARWDRALWELRQSWQADDRGDFPITESTDGRSWGRRGHHDSTPAVEEVEETKSEASVETENIIDDIDAIEEANEPEERDDSATEEAFVDDDFGDLDDAFTDIEVPEESSEEPAEDDESEAVSDTVE